MPLAKAQSDVTEFHRRFCPDQIGTVPAIVSRETEQLRLRLIREEFSELSRAIRSEDLPGIADGIGDLIYVALGTAVAYGISMDEVWQAIQTANLAKADGPVRADGKRLKPEGWQPPDIAGILARQGWAEETEAKP